MNQTTMRTRFEEHVSDLSSDLDDAAIDEYLNRAYQYVIPADVGGEFNETTWELQAAAGTDTYDYASHVVAPNGESAWIKSYMNGAVLVEDILTFLDIETSHAVFEYADRYGTASQSRPSSALFYGRQVILSPVPDLDYIVNIPSRGGPSAGLTATGIENDIHAMATVTSAASEFLAESEDAEGFTREDGLYQRYLARLHVYAQARPNARRPKRSF